MYADYEFYTTAFVGSAIAEDDFPRFATRASSYIDYITLGKAMRHRDLEAVKMACCALAEQYQRVEIAEELAREALKTAATNATSGELQSQTVGGWSKTYRSGGDSATAATQAAEAEKSGLYATAKQYLAFTGLLYRGRCSR